MNEIKILHFPIRNNKGGVTQYVLNNWKHIDKDKFIFDFATMNSKLDFEEEVIKQGCKVFYLSTYAEDDRDRFIQEIDRILDNNYDVIHLHTGLWKSTIVEERAKIKGVKKVIIHSHSAGICGVSNYLEYEKALLKHQNLRVKVNESLATEYCACSWEAAEWLYADNIPKDKIKILSDAIEVERFLYNDKIRNEYRKKLNINNNFVIGHVGRFTYEKNHELLIEVFSKVKKYILNSVLLLIGTGTLEKDIKRLVLEKELEDYVYFLGNKDDVCNWYQAMDMFVLPSRYEGFGMALLEAQIAGLPCITSKVISKYVQISDGLYLEDLNIEKWYLAILNMNKNRIIIDQQKVKEFDIKKKVLELEEMYIS